MTTIKRCPECGSEFLTTLDRCLDCDGALVERDDGADGDTELNDTELNGDNDNDNDNDGDGDGDDDHDNDGAAQDSSAPDEVLEGSGPLVRYELHEWSAEGRSLLEQLVAGAGIARAWEGTTLVVGSVHRAEVDELVDQAEAAERPALDPEAERVVYEVADWSADQITVLTDALSEQGISYEFDIEGDLAVLTDDEDRVEAVLDDLELGSPEAAVAAGDDDPDDGIETAGILSDLFVACDRLQHDATDHEGVLGAVSAGERLAVRPLPFGYQPSVWDGILERAQQLRAAIDDDAIDDDALELSARELRDLLRQYV